MTIGETIRKLRHEEEYDEYVSHCSIVELKG